MFSRTYCRERASVQSNLFSHSVRLDKIGRLFGDGDDRSDGMPTDLAREDGRVDDAEALNAEHAKACVNDASIGGGADAR